MSTEIQVFNFDSLSVRTLVQDGDPWWVASDVCRVLTIGNVSLAINGRPDRRDDGIDDGDKGVAIVNTPGGPQEMAIVNESGLYDLIFKSRKPEAKRFKKWITSEVIPAIRKTGRYEVQAKPLSGTELMLAQARMLVEFAQKQLDLESAQSKHAIRLDVAELNISTLVHSVTEANAKAEDALARLNEDTGYTTVLGYSNLKGFKFSARELSSHGQGLTSYCKHKGVEVKKLPSEKWGTVNAYPLDILDDWFGAGSEVAL